MFQPLDFTKLIHEGNCACLIEKPLKQHERKVANHTSSHDCGQMTWSCDKGRSLGESVEDITVFVEPEVR